MLWNLAYPCLAPQASFLHLAYKVTCDASVCEIESKGCQILWNTFKLVFESVVRRNLQLFCNVFMEMSKIFSPCSVYSCTSTTINNLIKLFHIKHMSHGQLPHVTGNLSYITWWLLRTHMLIVFVLPPGILWRYNFLHRMEL